MSTVRDAMLSVVRLLGAVQRNGVDVFCDVTKRIGFNCVSHKAFNELLIAQQASRNINSRGLSYHSSRLVKFRSFVCGM